MDALDSLIERLPPGAVTTHPGEVASHAHDRRALALLRDVRGDRVAPPAAVVFPASTDEVAWVLRWAAESGTAVVPRGGATGVSGGAEALKRSVVVDMSRMTRIAGIDDVSQTVEAEAGVRGLELEMALDRRGLTLGHDPDSLLVSTVGGWIAAAAAGVTFAGYGGIEQAVLGLTVVLSGGDVLRLRPVVRAAGGPDLRRLFVGSEGTLGVITEATLSVGRGPAARPWEVFVPHSFDSGVALAREITQRGFRPLVLRVLDEAEAVASFGVLGHARGPMLIAGFDPEAPAIEAERFELRRLARELGARAVGPEPAEHWWDHRFDPMEWYEGVMGPERTAGDGVIADFVDTGALWRRVPGLYHGVRGALLDHAETVTCHLAHPSRSGASLRFTFVLRAGDDRQVEADYGESWEAAGRACRASGGTIGHHLGVGILKLPFLGQELGSSGVSLLRGLKGVLDPSGVMNPGKLVPAAEPPPEGTQP